MSNKTKTKVAKKIFNRIVNITSDEWPRIYLSWIIQFLYRSAFIIGWTALIAIYVTTYGILALPYFFIIYALSKMLSAYIYSHIISRLPKDKIILYTALIGACLFLFVSLAKGINPHLFIISSIVILAMILSQLYILNNSFIEELFTPLESERTFPIIESAETVGGIVGGLVIASLASIMPTENFITIVVICLALIAPIMLFQRKILKKVPFRAQKKHKGTHFQVTNIKKFISNIKAVPFLKVLFIVVIAQWLFTNLLEFQFTKAVFQNIPDNAIHPEQELTHGLGTLHIFFYSCALVMQVLVASRILSSLGVIGSLLLHPVVTLLSLGAMLFRFGLPAAILSKLNFEMTTIIHKSSYHSSYYAIDPKMREQVRELLEGFAHPAGTLISMGLLLLLQVFFSGSILNISITVSMIVVMLLMLFVILKNENYYTKLSINNINQSKDPILQLNAVEVLGQKGHKDAVKILTKILNQEEVNKKVKVKIIETLGHMKNQQSIIDILDYAIDQDRKIRFAALNALNKFSVLKKDKLHAPFSIYRINNVLKRQFEIEKDEDIKALIIKILAKINKQRIVPYLIKLLESDNSNIKTNCISACYFFDDINLIHYLLPFLESNNSNIKASTIIALWKYPRLEKTLKFELKKMMHSKDPNIRIEAYKVIGKVKAHLEAKRLIDTLESANIDERLHAALALANLDRIEGNDTIVDSLIHANDRDKDEILHKINTLPSQSKNIIDGLIRQKVSSYINEIFFENDILNLEQLDKGTLLKLRNAYELVNEHEEVQNIDELLLQFNPI